MLCSHNGRGLAMHNHVEAWQVVLAGVKQWWILPPTSRTGWIGAEGITSVHEQLMLSPPGKFSKSKLQLPHCVRASHYMLQLPHCVRASDRMLQMRACWLS